MTTIYGIPNCDSCRHARKWLEEHAVEHDFHDIRTDGLEVHAIHQWAKQVGWKKLLNTRSQTWRKIPQPDREEISEGRALALMFDQPTLIKRPVLEHMNQLIVGFSAAEYQELFG